MRLAGSKSPSFRSKINLLPQRIGEMFAMIDLPAVLLGFLGAFAGGVAWATSELIIPRRCCPNCDAPFPKLYWPRSWRQGWRGGKTCKKCGCETDHLGRII